MGDGTEQNPYTPDDVRRLIEEKDGKTEGLDLSDRVFEKGIDLRKLDLWRIILKNASLEEAHLEGTRLAGARLEDAWLADAHLDGSDLEETHLEGAWLLGANFSGAYLGAAHLEGANLQSANLEETYLESAEISHDTRLENVNWGNYILGEEKDGYFDVAVDTYRRLKAWHTNNGISDIAAKFYYREKEAERKSYKLLSENWHHRLALQASYLAFGHGERWRRIPLWMAFFLTLFAAAYYFWGRLEPLDSLYFSAVSFTALGYGNWAPEPIGWVKVLGAFEAFVGVFMMALLLVTFVRKWTR